MVAPAAASPAEIALNRLHVLDGDDIGVRLGVARRGPGRQTRDRQTREVP